MRHEGASSTTLNPRDGAVAPHESAASPSCSLSEIATSHVARAARLLNLPEEIALILGQPQNEITVNFPMKMDSGSYRVFKGYRVQHNDIMGPYKGGLRYCQNLTLDECKGLALSRLASAMRRTYAEVRTFSSDCTTDLRTAAYALGLLRIQTAYADRGIWP